MRRLRFSLVLLLVTPSVLVAQTQYDTSPGAQNGVYGSYFDTDIDSVSLFNGNLNLRINLLDPLAGTRTAV